jgi:hypothetical protein
MPGTTVDERQLELPEIAHDPFIRYAQLNRSYSERRRTGDFGG